MQINCIYVIESLTGEEKTGKILYDKIVSEFSDRGFKAFYFDIKNMQQLFETFIQIVNETNNNEVIPLIHMEFHGCDQGIGIEPSEEFVPWKHLENYFRQINIKMKNSLIITLGVCYGAHLQLICDPSKPAPFFELLTPINSIFNTEILSGYSNFYKGLLSGEDYISLVKQLKLNDKFKFYGSAHLYKSMIPLYETLFTRDSYGSGKTESEKYLKDNNIYGPIKEINFEEFKKLLSDDLRAIKDNYLMIDLYPENLSRFQDVSNELEKLINKFA